MIKNIKRAGIIFLAIAIICLMVIGCLVSTNVIVVGGANRDSLANFENKEVVADSEINEDDYDFILAGGDATMATIWTNAIEQAKTSGEQVKVLMKSYWNAQETTMTINGTEIETTAFGKDINAFKDGAIYIPEGANILLDLNGCRIDRHMKEATYNGMVFYVDGGTLTIEDNQYDEESALLKYNEHKDLGTESLRYYIADTILGGITGGAGIGDAGAGGIYATNGSTINFNSGKIYNNIYSKQGAGIYAENNCVVNINGGMIFGNKSSYAGGGIYVVNCTFNLNKGLILANTATYNGGAIYALKSKVNVEDIIVSTNAVYRGTGGGVCLMDCDTTINNGLFHNNSNAHDGGGIYAASTKDSEGNWNQSKCVVNNATITNNYSHNGAGLYFRNGIDAVVNNCEIGGNKSDNVGAGLVVYMNAKCIINNINIHDNVALNDNLHGGSGTGLYVGVHSKLTFNGGKVVNNRIMAKPNGRSQGYGAGIGVYDEDDNISIVNLNGGTVSGNIGWDDGVGLYVLTTAVINVSKAFKVFDNYKVDENNEIIGTSDVYVKQGQKINITGALEGTGEPHIGICLADDYGNEPFTSGYSTYNTDSPYMHFFNNKESSIAALNNGDVVFENIISSNVYDFVYLESGKRKYYKDNNLTHAVNDYVKRQEVNGGKLVLGNIAINTSVNQFVSNINYEGTKIKLLNGANEVVFGEGADSKFADKLNNGNEFAVGTGWRLKIYTHSGDMIEEIYLSVLGDLTGDVKLNSADLNYLRQITNNNDFENLNVEQKLAALIVNKGKEPASTDIQILWETICGRIDINEFI